MAVRPKQPRQNETKVKIQATVSPEIARQLDERAAKEKRSVSAVIALAVAAYLEGDQPSLPLRG